ncbi:MAG: hypothetical protein LBK29_04425, partial [Oscillospiraceae bacterium]|nr:hypothetical protein [Oscillospiraceae bacterium]
RPGSSASPSTSEFGAFSDLPFEAGIEPRDPAPLPSPAPPLPSPYPFPPGVNLESAVRLNGLAEGFFNSVEILLNLALNSDLNSKIDDSISKVEKLLKSPILTGQEHFDSYFEKIGFDVKQLFSDKISKCLKFIKDLKQKIKSDSHYVGPTEDEKRDNFTKYLQEVSKSCLELRKSIGNTIVILSGLIEEMVETIVASEKKLRQLTTQELGVELSELNERSSFITKCIGEFCVSTEKLKAYESIGEKDNLTTLEKLLIKAHQHMLEFEKIKTTIYQEILARGRSDTEIDELNSELKNEVKRVKKEIKEFLVHEKVRRFDELKEIETERLRLLEGIEEHSRSYKDEALKQALVALKDRERYDPEDGDTKFSSLEMIYYDFLQKTIEIAIRCTKLKELEEFGPIFSKIKEVSSEAFGRIKKYTDDRPDRQGGLSVSSAGKLKDEIEEKSKSLEIFIESKKPIILDIAKRLRRLKDSPVTELSCTIQKKLDEAVCKIQCIDIPEMIPRSSKHAEYIEKAINFRESAIQEIKNFKEFAIQETKRINNSESELMGLISSQHKLPAERMGEHRLFVYAIFRDLGITGHALNPWLMAIKNLLNSGEVQRFFRYSEFEFGLKIEITLKSSNLIEIGMKDFLGDGQDLPKEFSGSDEFLRSKMNYLAGLMVLIFLSSSVSSGENSELVLETFGIFFRVTDEECSMQDQKAGLQVLKLRSLPALCSQMSRSDEHIVNIYRFLEQNEKFKTL